MEVECQECLKRFTARWLACGVVQCPDCGSEDVDLPEED